MSNRRIGIELTALHSELRSRGVGRVAQGYFEELSSRPDIHIFPYSNGEFPDMREEQNHEPYRRLYDRWRLAWFYLLDRPDLIQIIDPIRTPPLSPSPVVTMVHDLIPYLLRERYQTTWFETYIYWRMKRQIRGADLILTPTRHVGDELEVMFDLDPESIRPVHHGIDHRRFYPRDQTEVEEIRREYNIYGPYVLMVSDLAEYDPQKRLEEVVEAWDPEKLSEVNLVIVGRKGEYEGKLRQQWDGDPDRLIFPGFVNDDELSRFYSGARLLAFPVRYAGFGFPVLEAMACGTRPVVRATGSMSELCGDAAVILEEDAYRDQLLEVLVESRSWERTVEECVEHAARYRWDRCIDRVVECYEEVM